MGVERLSAAHAWCWTSRSTAPSPWLIQYFRGSYGRVEMGPMMACIMLTIFPIVVVYLAGTKAHHQGRGGRSGQGLIEGPKVYSIRKRSVFL